jgi:hypothetical protein
MFNRTCGGYADSSDCKRCEEECIVASDERLRELEERYEGYTVYDNRGNKIGKVDDLFIDEADREEYVGVKLGFLGRKSTLIPMDIVRVNEADKALEVSESKDKVKDAPNFDDDEDITSEYEERIRRHFGLQPTESSSTQGTYAGHSAPGEGSRRDPVEDRMRESAARSSGTSSGDSGSRDVPEYAAGTTESRESGETPGTPSSPQTGASEQRGRAKVRRRIIREEIIEEDPDDRS